MDSLALRAPASSTLDPELLAAGLALLVAFLLVLVLLWRQRVHLGALQLQVDTELGSVRGFTAFCDSLLRRQNGQEEQIKRLERFSRLDPHTGLSSGRYFQTERWPVLLRSASPLAVFYVDLDGLKAVNDRYGHNQGDRYIASAAEALRSGVRRGLDDVVRLYGSGDEFLIAACVPSIEQARRIDASIRAGLRTQGISASIGIAFTESRNHEARAALRGLAESAMLAVKRAGGGRSKLHGDPLEALQEDRAPDAPPEPIEEAVTKRHFIAAASELHGQREAG
jgi:diguanylate cyclase (GGDEF)-like protein